MKTYETYRVAACRLVDTAEKIERALTFQNRKTFVALTKSIFNGFLALRTADFDRALQNEDVDHRLRDFVIERTFETIKNIYWKLDAVSFNARVRAEKRGDRERKFKIVDELNDFDAFVRRFCKQLGATSIDYSDYHYMSYEIDATNQDEKERRDELCRAAVDGAENAYRRLEKKFERVHEVEAKETNIREEQYMERYYKEKQIEKEVEEAARLDDQAQEKAAEAVYFAAETERLANAEEPDESSKKFQTHWLAWLASNGAEIAVEAAAKLKATKTKSARRLANQAAKKAAKAVVAARKAKAVAAQWELDK